MPKAITPTITRTTRMGSTLPRSFALGPCGRLELLVIPAALVRPLPGGVSTVRREQAVVEHAFDQLLDHGADEAGLAAQAAPGVESCAPEHLAVGHAHQPTLGGRASPAIMRSPRDSGDAAPTVAGAATQRQARPPRRARTRGGPGAGRGAGNGAYLTSVIFCSRRSPPVRTSAKYTPE